MSEPLTPERLEKIRQNAEIGIEPSCEDAVKMLEMIPRWERADGPVSIHGWEDVLLYMPEGYMVVASWDCSPPNGTGMGWSDGDCYHYLHPTHFMRLPPQPNEE